MSVPRSAVRFAVLLAVSIVPLVLSSYAQEAAQPDWIARSNRAAQPLLQLQSRYDPESAGEWGVSGLDEEVSQFPADRPLRFTTDMRAVIAQLRRQLATERDSRVMQDLRILIKSAEDFLTDTALSQKFDKPYFNAAQMVFGGIRPLLDDQMPASRRQAALVRLREYAGLEPGYEPLTTQLQARTTDWSHPGQRGPAKVRVETDLARSDVFLNGLGDLFAKYQIDGYAEPLAQLKEQIAGYNAWIRQRVLPSARTDFRLPAEQYAFVLTEIGVDIPPARLASIAHQAFAADQAEMESVAAQVAKARGLEATDYRSVIRELKKDQLVGEAILPHYQQRLRDIEAIIQREHLATLPERPARIRLATPAETAQQAAPHMVPPPLLNNTGQQGEFVLPLNVPTRAGSNETALIDDYTFAAASWTLTAHEARPGHDLQFAAMIEHGVSLARSLFAFNSVNAEGWGLYAEHIMQPYEPIEGQLIALQLQLLRAARAFIDPELQSGRLTPTDAQRILTTDVMLSPARANTEVERYTFRAPGQATSYFYGYTRLLELRKDVETRLGSRFNMQRYHDFVVNQGLLPPALLRQAVMTEFVPAETRRYVK
jgi:uncharacterized protein DUF885